MPEIAKADPNDPKYKTFTRRFRGFMLSARALVMMTPNPNDDEFFDIVEEMLDERIEELYDSLQKKQAARAKAKQ